jgi:hypothetical protein
MVSDAYRLYALMTASGRGPKTISMNEVQGEGHVSLLPSLLSPMLRIVTR